MAEMLTYRFRTITQSFQLSIPSDALTSSVIESVSDHLQADASSIRLFNRDTLIPVDCIFSSRIGVNRPVLVSLPSDVDEDGVLDDGEEEESEDYLPEAIERYIANIRNISGDEWSREDCLRALQVVHFSPDRAAELLLSGEVPDHPALAFAKLNGTEPDPEVIHNENLKRLWAETRIDIPLLVQYYEACGRDYQRTYDCLKS
jgi:hypothetical protein